MNGLGGNIHSTDWSFMRSELSTLQGRLESEGLLENQGGCNGANELMERVNLGFDLVKVRKVITIFKEVFNGQEKNKALELFLKQHAAVDGESVSISIKDSGITDQNVLVEIAKIAVRQNPSKVSEYIKNFGIQSEEKRIEIAKIAAEIDPGEFLEFIQNYGIRDQDVLVEIAKIVFEKNPRKVSEYIKNFGIQSEEKRIEIAKIAAGIYRSGCS